MGVVRPTNGSEMLPPSTRTTNGPRNARQVARAMQKPGVLHPSSCPTQKHNINSKQANSEILPTGKNRCLRNLAPKLAGSRDFQKRMRPPAALPATHPSAYNTAHHGRNKMSMHSSVTRHDTKTVHVKMGLPTPSPKFEPLPSTPLFSTTPIKEEPCLYQIPLLCPSTKGSSLVRYSNSTQWSIPADPMRQTSMAPPDWQGKIGLLRSDTHQENSVSSPVCMTGLPFGGMVEMAEYYGPSGNRKTLE